MFCRVTGTSCQKAFNTCSVLEWQQKSQAHFICPILCFYIKHLRNKWYLYQPKANVCVCVCPCPSSVLFSTLGRSWITWPQVSRTTLSPTSCRPPTPPASTNLNHLCPAWPTSPPPPTSPPTLQIPTLPHTWPLAPEETPRGWWPTPLEAKLISNPRAPDKSCCSRLDITVSLFFFMAPQKTTNQALLFFLQRNRYVLM